MKLIITACTPKEIVRNNIIAGFTPDTTIWQSERTIEKITTLIQRKSLREAKETLLQETTFNEPQARIAIEIIIDEYQNAE